MSTATRRPARGCPSMRDFPVAASCPRAGRRLVRKARQRARRRIGMGKGPPAGRIGQGALPDGLPRRWGPVSLAFMNRRDWIKGTSAAGLALLSSRWALSSEAATDLSARFPALADAVLERAASLGAQFADLHFMQLEEESLFVREEMVQGVSAEVSLGASVRVLVDGAWGFAASHEISEARLLARVDAAVALAKGQAGWRGRPVEIESLPAHRGRWDMPVSVDPFAVSLEEKVERLLAINRAALAGGAGFCHSYVHAVLARKWLANSFGTRV